MAKIKPMFPLQIVAFPGERVPLHIFEPRYKQLIRDCRESGQTFFIPPVLDTTVQDHATEMVLTSISKEYPDGKMDIRTLAKSVHRIGSYQEEVRGKLYGGATTWKLPLQVKGSLSKNAEMLNLIRKLHKRMAVDTALPAETDSGVSFQVGHYIGLTLGQEFELLKLPTEELRQDYIIAHVRALIPIVSEMQKMRAKIQMNGHFRNLLPPDLK